ncbi:MAG: archease [Nitrospinae bacterium]|nr:archease [Nitrospinota bacterium]
MPYRFLEDVATADIAFEASGETLEELFIASALATTNVMIRDLQQIEKRERREIKVEAEEMDLLLFNFLQEIIFYKDAEQLLFTEYDVKINEKDTPLGLIAEVYGEKLNMSKHDLIVDVKAVTLHQFEIKKIESGWKATVILDI